ncbi:ATP synthase F1 subunit delta [uncultured Mailhella sp.]|uniref:ATP synthase F1 subunit delta n=1 Tax=uncultured Mailhella sp. TaxID=1981031 RepID=UPI0025CBBBEF|nr:ATP synthase F1 subunit delta [uncultured Mailhella sp.]
MIGNVVSRRYASALFSLGKEAGMAELERYGASLSALGEAVEKTPRLAEAFRNPVLSTEEKKKVVLSLLDVAGGGAVEQRFCALLADKGRLPLLPAIAADFSVMLDEARGISRGVVTTAVELDDAHKDSIKNKLESQTERKLELEYVIDPSIIGGIVFRVGDKVYDASLRAQLDNLRESIKRGE